MARDLIASLIAQTIRTIHLLSAEKRMAILLRLRKNRACIRSRYSCSHMSGRYSLKTHRGEMAGILMPQRALDFLKAFFQ